MSHQILIGDVHGCYYTLEQLVQKLEASQQLVMAGDLVGKGIHSKLVIDFLMQRKSRVVLGNHDLYFLEWLLGLCAENTQYSHSYGDFTDKEKHIVLDWLLHQSFCLDLDGVVVVHASLSHHWTLEQALEWSQSLMHLLRNDPQYFYKLYRQPISIWSDQASHDEKLAAALHIFTKVRYYQGERFNIKATGHPKEHPDLEPWYTKDHQIENIICFGHWAALKGAPISAGFINLDGGVVYGGQLLAYCPDTLRYYQSPLEKQDAC